MNEFRKTINRTLAELESESPNINPIGYGFKEFNQDNKNIQQAQANTIIKLLVKVCNKLEDLEDKLIKLRI